MYEEETDSEPEIEESQHVPEEEEDIEEQQKEVNNLPKKETIKYSTI